MRFAGSAVDFSPQSLQSAGGGSNYSAAAGAVDLADGFGAMREKAPRYDQLSAEAMKNQSAENISAMQAEADVMSAGVTAFGQTKGQALAGEATVKAAKAKAEAQKQASMIGAIGGIASAGLKLFTGGMA